MSNVNLVVVAHPDDEILGCGATSAKLVKSGELVQPIILCGAVEVRSQKPTDRELHADIITANEIVGSRPPVLGSFPNIRMNTVAQVDLVQFIEAQLREFSPSRVFTHHPADLNDDHKQVATACLAAARLFQRDNSVDPPASVYLMEVSSSTDWAFPGIKEPFQPNVFEEVSGFLDLKLEALAAYRNVMRMHPHPRSEEAIRGLAAHRGAQSGYVYAESFQMVFGRGV